MSCSQSSRTEDSSPSLSPRASGKPEIETDDELVVVSIPIDGFKTNEMRVEIVDPNKLVLVGSATSASEDGSRTDLECEEESEGMAQHSVPIELPQELAFSSTVIATEIVENVLKISIPRQPVEADANTVRSITKEQLRQLTELAQSGESVGSKRKRQTRLHQIVPVKRRVQSLSQTATA
mmetsp:Transcript_3306/g.6188  ORF Transcript_3306/g.6188 Transcript_3306/m.6188 type:complete len:180 (-) Transcript_3306:313-852(-)